MGPNLARLLKSYMVPQRIVPNTGKFPVKAFYMGRGLTQGDPATPTIFHTVVIAVVQAVLDVV